MPAFDPFLPLALGLIGPIVDIRRGWHERHQQEG